MHLLQFARNTGQLEDPSFLIVHNGKLPRDFNLSSRKTITSVWPNQHPNLQTTKNFNPGDGPIPP